MAILIGFLTFLMVLDCLLVILLVLIQLPKKDAGAGLAFGAGATDALFGAGSGTVLTKITKYAAGTFFAMALLLSILQSNYHRRAGSAFTKSLSGPGPITTAPLAAPAVSPASTNAASIGIPSNTVNTPQPEATGVPPVTTPAPSTNPAAPPPK